MIKRQRNPGSSAFLDVIAQRKHTGKRSEYGMILAIISGFEKEVFPAPFGWGLLLIGFPTVA